MPTRPPRPSAINRKRATAGSANSSSFGSFLDRWLSEKVSDVGPHRKVLLLEIDRGRKAIMEDLREAARRHYVSPQITAKRLADLGAKKTAALLKEDLPILKRARSGDVGEILATEFASNRLGYLVPIRRLQWKDGREMALRGDDIVAFVSSDKPPKLRFLKGEAKSGVRVAAGVINKAATALARDEGRPSRHSVNFVAKRLRESGQDEIATLLESTVLGGFRGTAVEHMLFTLCGNDPDNHLAQYLDKCKDCQRRCHAVGLRVEDHAQFISELYEDL